MALKKYDAETVMAISLNVDREISESYNFGDDTLSDLRRNYMEKFFRNSDETVEDGFSEYTAPLVQNHVLQSRAAIMRPWHKSQAPIVKFPKYNSTKYIDFLFRHRLNGTKIMNDLLFNGALLKTYATKVYVKVVRDVEEDVVRITGENKEEIKLEIVAFFKENDDYEEIDTIWREVEEDDLELVGESPDFPELPQAEQPIQPPVEPQAGAVPPEAQPVLDELFNNPQQPQQPVEQPIEEEEVEEEGAVEGEWEAIVRWRKIKMKRVPCIDVIQPYELHITRQAPSAKDAVAVGRITPMRIDELKLNFPNAPKMNGYKTKAEEDTFWKSLTDNWHAWTNRSEWYELWLKENASYFRSYYFLAGSKTSSTANTGSDESREWAILVSDTEIEMDIYDDGYFKRYNVIKAGNMILHCEEISQPCFYIGSYIDIAGKWVGYGAADMVWDEQIATTNMMRAADNAILQASYDTPVVDEEQVYLEDVISRRPDSVIRRKADAVPKQGVPAIESFANAGLDGNVFNIVDIYSKNAGTATGVGKFFEGFDSDNISKSRVNEETAKTIQNNSDLMLEEVKHGFWNYMEEVLVALHNASIIGRADPLEVYDSGEKKKIDPLELEKVSAGQLELIVGSDENQTEVEKAEEIFAIVANLEQYPSLAAAISPEGKTLAIANLLAKKGVEEELVTQLLQPAQADPMQNPEVQQALQQMQKDADNKVKQAIQEYMESDERKRKNFEAQAKVDSMHAKSEFDKENAAAEHAYKFELSDQGEQKIKDRKEEVAATIGIQEERLELDEKNSDREYDLAKSKDISQDLG